MASTSPDRGETRILIVPEGLLGDVLGESFLGRQSVLTRSAADGMEAVALAAQWQPHLVVFRSEPREDAVRIGSLKLQSQAPAPKLLMVTDRLEETRAAADTVCDAHLITPLAPAQLLATIAELLDLRQRLQRRAPLDVLVHTEGFTEAGAGDATLSTALGLSEDGILLEASRHLALRSAGRLQFFLPGQPERLTLEGNVRVAVDELRLIYVIDFVDLAPQHRNLIRRYVESRREAA